MPGQIAAKKSPFAANKIGYATMTIGAEAANVIRVAIQLQDSRRRDIAFRGAIEAYLSDDANGDSITATGPTTVAAGTDGVYQPIIAVKKFTLISEADGDIDLDLTLSSGAATWYLILIMPDGTLLASGAITFAA